MSISQTLTERLLGSATQTRFCAVFLEQETLSPIIGLPVYAEALCTTHPSPDEIHLDVDTKAQIEKVLAHNFGFSDTQIASLEQALLNSLTLKYGQPTEKELRIIVDRVIENMLSNKAEFVKNYSEDKIQELIEGIINELIDKQAIRPPHSDKKEAQVNFHIPFGYLATDQVGYVSFDIEKAIKRTLKEFKNSQLQIEYWMYPNGDLAKGINVSDMGRLNSSYVFGNIKLTNYQKVKSNVSYHSLQNPGLIDWYLSPSSFSINPKYFVGEDGCEKLYPANFATSEFRFFQIIRGNEVDSNQGDLPIIHGSAFEYNTLWQPLGHTLGQIIYSLPLAPGEVIKIGIIDWKRKSEDSRKEDASESEDLTHDTLRDRTISETVDAALKEWQRGGSVMGGNSGGAGASFGIPIFGAAAGNAHSFGGGYSTSSGNRDIAIDTVQQVNDAFSQHSSAIRELRSTIVVQSDQSEYAKAETRVIANNNHSHALTMLYYEVLRHFKVTTQFVRKRNVLLVDYSRWKIDFNNEYEINKYRQLLESNLLEKRYLPYFDSVHDYIALNFETNYHNPKIVQPFWEGDLPFRGYWLEFTTGGNGYDGELSVDIFTTSGESYILMNGRNNRPLYSGTFENGDVDKFDAWVAVGGPNNPPSDLKWGELDSVRVKVNGGNEWRFEAFKMEGITSDGERRTLYNGSVGRSLEEGDREDYKSKQIILMRPPQAEVIPPQNALDQLQPFQRININILKNHLLNNTSYYWRLIWLNQDVNERAEWMNDVTIDEGKLIDLIENRPIDVLGNFVVFPSNYNEDESPGENGTAQQNFEAKNEKLMTLPSRGVFGEAKLGNCNASEIIDNTRFWDWQQSPIQEKAPEIDAISTESRNVTQNLTPTTFPSSIVNIVNPTAAPDPSGMVGALNLLGKSDIFRNMSMSAEVNDLLKKLSDNSVTMAQAANQARGILSQQNGSSSQGSGGSNNSSAPSGKQGENQTAHTSSPSTQEEKESKTLENTEKKLELAKKNLTPKQQQKVREKVTEDLTKITRKIVIGLRTVDGGGVVSVLEPGDYAIGTEQGKITFPLSVATIETTFKTNILNIKFNGQLPPIENRQYLDMVPGFANRHHNYYFTPQGSFNFSENQETITMTGKVTMDTSTELTFYVDANGNVSGGLNGEVEIALPAEVAHFTFGGKSEVQIGGQTGFKITYKVARITGMDLVQDKI